MDQSPKQNQPHNLKDKEDTKALTKQTDFGPPA
ncbi:BnaC06g10470D [Brassica napus]|uniref:BnaC06g10470D protein n=1 Tax=Brassica napus TaxID=3708 RepID=A0A078H1K9_BRANA|nr:BnaC06g10470D [Brassica napus]